MKNIFNRVFIIGISVFVAGQALAFAVVPGPLQTNFIDEQANSAGNCLSLTYQMRYGSRDARTNGEVSDLQFFLQDKGYLSIEPTGYFGNLTRTAVQNFQKDNSITNNGTVGPFTRAKIKAKSCGTSGTTVPVTSSTVSPGQTTLLLPFTFTNTSVSNGIKTLQLRQTITGAGPNLKACTGTALSKVVVGGSSGPCSLDSSFVFLKGHDTWKYNDVTDTYSIDRDISGFGYPDTDYFTKFITASGLQIEKPWRFLKPEQTAVNNPITTTNTSSSPTPTITLTNLSTGDGTKVLRLKQTVSGGGAGLRSCTGTISSKVVTGPSVGPCGLDALFGHLANQLGWSYNSSFDTYSVDMDVSTYGYPDIDYFTKFITASGGRTEKTWRPIKASTITNPSKNPSTEPVYQSPYSAPNQETCSDGSARRTVAGPSSDTGCGPAPVLPAACPGISSGTVWTPNSGTAVPCGVVVRTSPQGGTLLPGQMFIAPDSYVYNVGYGGWQVQYSVAHQMMVNSAESAAREERLTMSRAFMAANGLSALVFPSDDQNLNRNFAAWEAQWKVNNPGYLGHPKYTY